MSALEEALTVPRAESASTLTVQTTVDYEMELEEEMPTTYSSLPPSPRASEYSRRPLDISELQGAFNRTDPSPRRPFSSISDGESDTQEFWPARSRRQTLDYAHRPSLDTLQTRRNTLSRTSSNTTRHEIAKEAALLETELEVEEPATPVEEIAPANRVKERKTGLSLWDLLRDEDAAEQWEGWIADGKWERIANFLAVPLVVEKVS